METKNETDKKNTEVRGIENVIFTYGTIEKVKRTLQSRKHQIGSLEEYAQLYSQTTSLYLHPHLNENQFLRGGETMSPQGSMVLAPRNVKNLFLYNGFIDEEGGLFECIDLCHPCESSAYTNRQVEFLTRDQIVYLPGRGAFLTKSLSSGSGRKFEKYGLFACYDLSDKEIEEALKDSIAIPSARYENDPDEICCKQDLISQIFRESAKPMIEKMKKSVGNRYLNFIIEACNPDSFKSPTACPISFRIIDNDCKIIGVHPTYLGDKNFERSAIGMSKGNGKLNGISIKAE